MNVVDNSAEILTDLEVKELLEQRAAGKNGKGGPFALKNRRVIGDSTLEHLKERSVGGCSTLPAGATSEMVAKCFARFQEEGIALEEKEMVQLVNHVPTLESEIYMLVPQVSDRFPDKEEIMLEILAECFNLPAPNME